MATLKRFALEGKWVVLLAAMRYTTALVVEELERRGLLRRGKLIALLEHGRRAFLTRDDGKRR